MLSLKCFYFLWLLLSFHNFICFKYWPQRLETIRAELKDVYKKLEKQCLGECSLLEIGTISAAAFADFGKSARAKALTESEYADVAQLAEKANDVQTFLVNSDNAYVLSFIIVIARFLLLSFYRFFLVSSYDCCSCC